jgi:protein-disulfide isomerase
MSHLAVLATLAVVALPPCLGAALVAAAPAPGEVVRVEHHAGDALPSLGPATAPVTIELFFAPVQRSRLREMALVESLQAKHPSRLRVIYRIVKATGSSRLHYAALEAFAEGKFRPFLDALNAASRTNLNDAALLELGKSVGMDPQQLALAIANPPPGYDRVIEANERRRKQKIRGGGLPAILINGKVPRSWSAPAELEIEYAAALEAAEDLLDRGADPRALPDATAQLDSPEAVDRPVPVGNTDDTVEDLPDAPPLATPALELRGMPSIGPTAAQVTVAILCSPASPNCAAALLAARTAQEVYSDTVRIVWAPFFDVAREDAAELGLLADAALCAERVGTSSDDLDAPGSQGWRWVESMIAEHDPRRRHKKTSPEQVLEQVSDGLHVDSRAFAACRASQAGAAIRWIEKARHAGVRTSPSTVVGGRIYPSITDAATLQQLVGAELEPAPCSGCLRLDDYAPSWRKH